MTDRDRLLFDLCMALRNVPPGILRDLGKRRLLCGRRLVHRPKSRVTPAR
jgi:hypothetical protein